jgi:16S rRNA (cytosine1402-N4)-methyltransferase
MHQSVLLEETVDLLNVVKDGVYVDGTLGSGGHAEAVLDRLGPQGKLYGIDRDRDALDRSSRRLARFGSRFEALHGNYAEMQSLLKAFGVNEVDGVVLDFGVSSEQLDTAKRGFSFMQDGPLDMRMDQGQPLSAAEVVNTYTETELAEIFWRLGEERDARRIAKRIVAQREREPFAGTLQLADVVSVAKGGRRGRRQHPATKVFQALRMTVNRELEGIDAGLSGGLGLLKPGGRMAVISFHSLEDRCVKHFFRAHEGQWRALAQGGERWEGEQPPVRRVIRKALKPSDAECGENPRARSATLRVAERLTDPEAGRKGGYE